MGSPISLIVANLFMEVFECKPSALPPLPRLCLRYTDDTFSSKRQSTASNSYITLSPLTPHIQLTTEAPNSNGSIQFLDILVTPGPDSILLTLVYRKPTHTDQYLNWDSHHNLSAKYGAFNTDT